VDWLALAVAATCPAERLAAARVPAGRATSARSTGMPAGCCARAPVRAAGRTRALVVAVAVGDAVAEAEQGLVLAWRVPCTPVSIMLTAP
jgi:hypothetical protein